MAYTIQLISKLEKETGLMAGHCFQLEITANDVSFFLLYVGFKQCGSILLARTKDRMTLLKRAGVAARYVSFFQVFFTL